MSDVNMATSLFPPATVFESALREDNPSKLEMGGLSLTSWQIVIWILAGSVFIGVFITIIIAYVGCEYFVMGSHSQTNDSHRLIGQSGTPLYRSFHYYKIMHTQL